MSLTPTVLNYQLGVCGVKCHVETAIARVSMTDLASARARDRCERKKSRGVLLETGSAFRELIFRLLGQFAQGGGEQVEDVSGRALVLLALRGDAANLWARACARGESGEVAGLGAKVGGDGDGFVDVTEGEDAEELDFDVAEGCGGSAAGSEQFEGVVVAVEKV